jgi:aminopeptidase-like protein
MLDLIRELFPICRSIAGAGLRESLRRIQTRVPIAIHEVPTGTHAFDWTVPQEWTLRRATLTDPSGALIADTDVNNLHVLNYSTPFAGKLSLDALRPYLHSMPDKPKWIPYRTSYYKPAWGICLAHEVASTLSDGEYDVNVDTTIADGSLSYGELVIPGESKDEVLFSTHCCHPSLANDNLSGIAVAVELAKWLASRDNALSYRFVFIPGTIGSITWLSQNVEKTSCIVAGLVLSCVGDGGAFTYKQSRQGTSLTDCAVERALKLSGELHSIRDFVPYGYDERQYCSPGFDLPVGCFMRTPNGEYPEYHTSADGVSFVREDALHGSVEMLKSIVWQIELAADQPRVSGTINRGDDGDRFVNLNPQCEPQLGRRGLYAMMGGKASVPDLQMALLWVLNYSDGQHGIDWIAQRAKIDPRTIDEAVTLLRRANLLTSS